MSQRHSASGSPVWLRAVLRRVFQVGLLCVVFGASQIVFAVVMLAPLTQANRVKQQPTGGRIPFPPGSRLSVNNRVGSIHITTWSSAAIELTASPRRGRSPGAWYSLTTDGEPAGLMTVDIRPPGGRPIDVDIAVPVGASLQLRTENGMIEVRGAVGNLTAESQRGDIVLKLPPHHDADLALHSRSGSIRSELPASIFGRFDSHNLQAKLGQGGAVILARTMTGNVSLLPLSSATQVARRASSDMNNGDQPVSWRQPAEPDFGTSRRPRRLPAGSPPAPIPGEPGQHSLPTRYPTRPVLRRGPETGPPGASHSPAPHASTGNDSGDMVRLEAPLVNLNISVSNRSGRAVTDLTKDDFTVYEDGVEQEVTYFASSTTPFDLILLLNLSGSAREKLRVIKRAAERFVDMIKPADRLGVYTFRGDVQVVSQLTNDRRLLKQRIGEIRNRQGDTALYHGLMFTAGELTRSSNRRKAIVVMTDGVQDSDDDENTFGDVVERFEESNMIVYPIYLDTEYEWSVKKRFYTAEEYRTARQQLKELAERTAGVVFRADRFEDLEGTYQQVANELRTVYSLAYGPTNAVRDGTWRRVRVKVNRPSLAVRSKRGYTAR